LNNAPDLSMYDYQAWDEDTREFVNSVLRMYLNPGHSITEVVNNDAPTKTKTESKKKEKAKEPVAAENSVNTDDDLDSFLNDLDI